MKAEEFIAKHGNSGSVDSVVEIVSDLIDETVELTNKRKCKTPRALLGVFNEQNQKWKKIVRLLKVDEPTHLPIFKNGLDHCIPGWKDLIEQMKPWTEKRFYRDQSRLKFDVQNYWKGLVAAQVTGQTLHS